MRLKKEQIHQLSERVFHELQTKNLMTMKADASTILHRIEQAITKNFEDEVKLDDDVRKIMEKYRAQISSGQLNEQQVFQMIKKQLVKDRKLVI